MSLFITGFSSWQIGSNNTNNINLITNYGDIIDLNSNVSFLDIEMFKYCKYGIVSDYTITYTGSIIIPFYFQVKDGIYEYLTNKSEFTFNTRIYVNYASSVASDFNLFSYVNNSIEYRINSSSSVDINKTTSGSLNANYIDLNITYSDNSLYSINMVYCYLKLNFDFSSVSNTFETSIYNNLVNSNGTSLTSLYLEVDLDM